MTTVAVHGSYFANNFGDTLLIKLMCERAAELVGRDNVSLAVEGHRAEQEAIGFRVTEPAERGSVDVLVFAGGGYFGEPRANWRARRRWYRRNSARHLDWVGDFTGARVAVLGAGYGPLSNARFRRRVDAFLARAEVVLLRDQESIDYYDGEAELCVDLALGVASTGVAKDAVALHLYDIDDAHRQSLIALAVERFPDREILLINDSPRNSFASAAIADQVKAAAASRSAPIRVVPYAGVDDLFAILDRSAVVVTSKLHVGIVATALGAAVVSLPIHPKTVRLYRQLGVEQYCVPYERRDPTPQVAKLWDSLERFAPDRSVIGPGVARIGDALERVVSGFGGVNS